MSVNFSVDMSCDDVWIFHGFKSIARYITESNIFIIAVATVHESPAKTVSDDVFRRHDNDTDHEMLSNLVYPM